NAMAANSSSPYYRPGNPPDYTVYFIPSLDAEGGQLIPELACNGEPGPCQFQDYPGTVWFSRLSAYSELFFDPDRSNYFHYLLSVHAIAKPQSPYPCVVNNSNPPDLRNYDGSGPNSNPPALPVGYDPAKTCSTITGGGPPLALVNNKG